MSLKKQARRLGFGRAAYLLYHAPASVVRNSLAAGGPLEQWRDARGRGAMERAAASLPTARTPADLALPELHFLTGRKFWYQTAFCLHSLQHHSSRVFRAVFHDDGSFDGETTDRLRTLFPAVEIRRRAENDARVDALLPAARFPFLHAERRQRHPNFLKITHVHAGATGWRLVLDSDMLFFRRPDFLLAWLAAPDRPLHMLDVADAYGYSRALMEAVAGAPIPSCLNVGLWGFNSGSLDWERLEFWCRRLVEAEGTSYYIEQALCAMLVANQPRAIAPKEDYLLMPDNAECVAPHAAMHHYVAASKRGYFRHAWRHIR
ncbi:MAG TPA: glycosyl transferase family 2 [Opitutaceae bacterium]|nr:glycosyl transferase family 2 [Opitutaceae bacterium]